MRHAAFELVLSTGIAEDVLHSLAYPKVLKAARSRTEPELRFEDILVLMEMTRGEHHVSGIRADPDDDKYVAAAIEGDAPRSWSQEIPICWRSASASVRFVTPRAFLDLLVGR